MELLIKIPEIPKNYHRCFALHFASKTLFLQKIKLFLGIKEGEEFTVTNEHFEIIENQLEKEAEKKDWQKNYALGLPQKSEEFNES